MRFSLLIANQMSASLDLIRKLRHEMNRNASSLRSRSRFGFNLLALRRVVD